MTDAIRVPHIVRSTAREQDFELVVGPFTIWVARWHRYLEHRGRISKSPPRNVAQRVTYCTPHSDVTSYLQLSEVSLKVKATQHQASAHSQFVLDV